jgi:hypothetical protein
MAQVPGSDAVPQVGLTNTRDIVAVPRSAELDAQTRFAGAAVRVVEGIADQQNEIAANRADLEAARQLEDIRQRYEADDDWMTAPTRARAEAQVVLAGHGAGLRGAATQRAWVQRSGERLLQFEGVMRSQSRARGVSLTRAEIVRFGDEAEQAAGDLTRPEEERRLAALNFTALLDSAEQRGLLDPDQGAELESRFTESVRRRVSQGLEAEWRQRIDMDPDDLAVEMEAAEGPWAVVDPNVRASWVREARQAGASAAINQALEETVRTGQIIGEDDERLADRWDYLGEGARLQYAERASAALRTHRAATALGSLSGLSLAEIAARADQASEGGGGDGDWTGPAAVAHLRAARSDPAAYINSTQPTVSQARARLRAAREAAAAEGAGPEAAANASEAGYAYGLALLQMQDAIGVPPGRQRLYERSAVDGWARRTRSLPVDRQAAAIERLPEQLIEYWGDDTLAARALQEHVEAFAVAQAQPGLMPPPDSAVNAGQGASYDNVRDRIVRLMGIGADLDSPQVAAMVGALSPADRSRLMTDPAIARASGMEPPQ